MVKRILLLTLLSVGLVGAEPTGPQIIHGQVNIQNNGATTLINQASDRAIINWNGFNIDVHELVRFVQPNQLSVILNRVVGTDPSSIQGQLQANGRVFLINPNGILFGPSAKVDVGGLMATTLNLKDQDFLAGRYHLAQDPNQRLASVINEGELQVAEGGFLLLVAPKVDNQGVIFALAKLVNTQQATLNFDGQGLVEIVVPGSPTSGAVAMTPASVSEVLRQVVADPHIIQARELSDASEEPTREPTREPVMVAPVPLPLPVRIDTSGVNRVPVFQVNEIISDPYPRSTSTAETSAPDPPPTSVAETSAIEPTSTQGFEFLVGAAGLKKNSQVCDSQKFVFKLGPRELMPWIDLFARHGFRVRATADHFEAWKEGLHAEGLVRDRSFHLKVGPFACFASSDDDTDLLQLLTPIPQNQILSQSRTVDSTRLKLNTTPTKIQKLMAGQGWIFRGDTARRGHYLLHLKPTSFGVLLTLVRTPVKPERTPTP